MLNSLLKLQNSLLLGLEEGRKCLHTDVPLCTIYCHTPVMFGLLVRNITSVRCGNKFCTRELQYVDLSFFFWFRLFGSALGWQFPLFTLPINVLSLDTLQKVVDSILMSCCVFVRLHWTLTADQLPHAESWGRGWSGGRGRGLVERTLSVGHVEQIGLRGCRTSLTLLLDTEARWIRHRADAIN